MKKITINIRFTVYNAEEDNETPRYYSLETECSSYENAIDKTHLFFGQSVRDVHETINENNECARVHEYHVTCRDENNNLITEFYH